MDRTLRVFSLVALWLCLMLAWRPWAAQQGSEPSLAELESRIEGEKADLAKLRSQESSVLALLENIDLEFEKRNERLEQLNERIAALVAEVDETVTAMDEVSKRLEIQRESFSERAQALYKWQRWGSPFVLLTGDVSVLELMRRARYLEIVLAHDRDLIAGLHARTVEIGRLQRDLEAQNRDLQEERSRVVALRASIRRERERKRATLYAIRREVRLRERALEELERASRELQKVIDRSAKPVVEATGVEESEVAVTESVSDEEPATHVAETPAWDGFEKGRGQLELPVKGRIIGGFGRRQHPDLEVEVDRKGFDIAALDGEEIRAVAPGEVIFSNRLSGYGRMVIIDHGERYYTVYAHLSELYTKVGERVKRGERIAAVGESGTFGGPRLYFEVRKDGRPIDPAPWFKDAPSQKRAASKRDRRASR